MSSYLGPNIVTDGLVLSLDAANTKSYIKNSIINMSTWTLGSGGCTNYSQNGNTNENERITGTNPWGNSTIVWETRASGDGNDDGGWNTGYFSVDYTKLYRFSVWVKRTSDSAGGTFYLGYGGCVYRFDNVQECNPYWHCGGTSELTKDQWYLFVGHIFPSDYSGNSAHPNTGIWTIQSGKVGNINGCNIGVDCKFVANTTSAYHRTYHFYCADNTTRLHLYNPRVDLCDGNEPTITELLTKSPAILYDLTNSYNSQLVSGVTYNSANMGSLVFDGVDDYIDTNLTIDTSTSYSYTLCGWSVTPNKQAYDINIIGNGYGGSDNGFNIGLEGASPRYWMSWGNSGKYAITASEITNNIWFFWTLVANQGLATYYINCVSKDTMNYTSGGNNGRSIIIGARRNSSSPYQPQQFWNGKQSYVQIYNRALSQTEITQNYNATKSRYGL